MSETTTLTPATIEDEEAALDTQWREAQGVTETPPPAEETRTPDSPDATAVTTADDVDTAALAAEYEALQQEAAGKEGQEARAPESRQPAGPDPVAVEQGRQQARALHAKVQGDIDAYQQELVDADVPPALAVRLIKEMKDRTNELYAGLLPLAGYEFGAKVEQDHHAALMDALALGFGGTRQPDGSVTLTPAYQTFWKGLEEKADKATGQVNYATLVQHFADTLYKGYVSPDDHAAAKKDEWIKGRGHAERIAKAARNTNNGATGVPTVIGGGMTKAEYEALTPEQYDLPDNQAKIRAYEMGAMSGAR